MTPPAPRRPAAAGSGRSSAPGTGAGWPAARRACRWRRSPRRAAGPPCPRAATVDGRCATTRAVVSASSPLSAWVTFASVCTSSADSGSSRMSSEGRARMARASATRCRWPPDRAMPCSPIRVSRPQGRSCTKPAWATASAASIASSSASGRAEADVLPDAGREQRRVLERAADPGPQHRQRQPPRRRCRPAGPPRRSRRPAGAPAAAGSSCPHPVAPASTMVWPGSRSRLTSRSNGCSAPG